MKDQTGQPLSLGSGFVVSEELVVTNYHVIRGAAAGSARLVGDKSTYVVAGVVASDPARDLAVLRLPGLKASPLSMLVDEPTAIGETVFAIGNPMGLERALSR